MTRRIRRSVVALVAVIGLAGCWLQPGFDSERGAFNPSDGAITPGNVSGLHQHWVVPIGGSVYDPAVSTDGVYVAAGGALGGGAPSTVRLLDASDGATRWSSVLANGSGSPLTPGSPTLLGDALYVPLSSYTPLVSDSIRVFDAANGAARSPIARRTAVVTAHDTRLVGTQGECTDTGQCAASLWVYDTVGTGSWQAFNASGTVSFSGPTSAAVGSNRIVIGRERSGAGGTNLQSWSLDKPANCTNPPNGPDCPPQWSVAVPDLVAGHPVLSADNRTVYAASATTLLALDAATGTPRWTATLGAAASAAPALADGSLYVPTGNGDLAVFAANGCGHATCRTVWTAHTTSSIGQQPAVTSGGIVYVASADGVLRAYPAAGCGHPTCASLWSAPTGSMITGGPVAALGNVYVGTSDGRLIAYGP